MPIAKYIIIAILLGWLFVLAVALFKKSVLTTLHKILDPKGKTTRHKP